MTTHIVWERAFEFSVPVDRLWSGYFEMEGTGSAPSVGATATLTDAARSQLEVTEVVERERFSYEQLTDDERITVTVVFEATETGSRIVITHSGFGDLDEYDVLSESRALGYAESMLDLALYLETGVADRRHLRERSAVGVVFKVTDAGLVVRRVPAGSTGEQAGLEPGDLLSSVNGATVYGRSDLWFLARLLDVGAEVELGFVRDGKPMTGRGRMCAVEQAVTGELGLGPRDREPSAAS